MTQLYHWLGRDVEPHHEELPAGMLLAVPFVDLTDPQNDE